MVTKIQCGGRGRDLSVVVKTGIWREDWESETYPKYVSRYGLPPARPAYLEPITAIVDSEGGNLIGCSGEYGGECVRNNEPPAKLRHAPCPFVR